MEELKITVVNQNGALQKTINQKDLAKYKARGWKECKVEVKEESKTELTLEELSSNQLKDLCAKNDIEYTKKADTQELLSGEEYSDIVKEYIASL